MINPRQFLYKLTIIIIFISICVCIFFLFLLNNDKNESVISIPKDSSYRLPDFEESLLQNFSSKTKILIEKTKEDLFFLGSIKRPNEPLKLFFSQKNSQELIIVKNKDVVILSNSILLKARINGAYASVELSKDDESLEFDIERSQLPFNLSHYKIGSHAVDSLFLVKSKAKFIGQDLFMLRHANKEGLFRLDFENYSLYIKENSILYYNGSKWKEVTDWQKCINYPLIEIQKIDEKSLCGVLYPPNLPLEFPISISKYPDLNMPVKAPISFNYIGSRNLKEWLFEVDSKKVSVKEGDWWLLADGDWRLLNSEEDIDNYVERKLLGELFIIDSIEREEGEKVLKGHCYNTLRTKEYEISLPLKAKKTTNNVPYHSPNNTPLKKAADPSRVEYAK